MNKYDMRNEELVMTPKLWRWRTCTKDDIRVNDRLGVGIKSSFVGRVNENANHTSKG